MKSLLELYGSKLCSQGLCDTQNTPLLAGIDDEITWNRESPEIEILEKAVRALNINSFIFARPAEPYASIMDFLFRRYGDAVRPEDSESRTFLHDIPFARAFSPEEIIRHLKRRKSLIIPGYGVAAYGTVSIEQAFVSFSSVCFACFVKFFTDFAGALMNGKFAADDELRLAHKAFGWYKEFLVSFAGRHFNSGAVLPEKLNGPYLSADAVFEAIDLAGKLTVDSRMVDSYFGNISCRLDDIIYISQTGSSLDNLPGHVDPCHFDNSTSNAITASSEFSAHKSIYDLTDYRVILHGHPKFCVIMSMLCDEKACELRGQCHRQCKKERFIADIPVIPGEVGTGPYGISRTLPPVMKGRGAIVYGHGLFCSGKAGFDEALRSLSDVEMMCLNHYENRYLSAK